MTESSGNKKRTRITCRASRKGVKKAESALIMQGFETKTDFAESQSLSRSTITRFFSCEPIQVNSFKRICEALALNWRNIVDLPAEDSDQKRLLVEEIRNNSVQRRDLSDADLSDTDLKNSQLIYANLQGANLNNCDLRGADLTGANLSEANLSEANLSDADLTIATLSEANLSDADLNNTDLRGASLSRVNLSRVNLNAAQIQGTRFRSNLGISEEMKQALIKRGAVFEDFPSDRSSILATH